MPCLLLLKRMIHRFPKFLQIIITGMGGQTIQNLKPPFICVDCGAHAGLTTDIIVHCGWIAHSFEPNIYLYEILKRKYLNTPNVYIYQKAVSNKKLYNKFFI